MSDLVPISPDLAELEARAEATLAVLNPRRAKFVSNVVSGMSLAAAAKAAGFKQDGTRYSSHLAAKPPVRAAIDAGRALTAAKAGYTVEAMMDELGRGMEFALKTENASAYVRAIELRGKLTGILVDRLDARIAIGGFVVNVHGLAGGADG